MSLMHYYYDPLSEIGRLLGDACPSCFLRHITTPRAAETVRDFFRPKMDVYENAENNTVTATFDLPGTKREDVNIDANQDRLSILGETSSSEQRDEGGYTVHERSWGRFSRTLMLPQGIKPENVKAKMENGVLNVTFPKAQPQQLPKRITIE